MSFWVCYDRNAHHVSYVDPPQIVEADSADEACEFASGVESGAETTHSAWGPFFTEEAAQLSADGETFDWYRVKAKLESEGFNG